jgi:transposase
VRERTLLLAGVVSGSFTAASHNRPAVRTNRSSVIDHYGEEIEKQNLQLREKAKANEPVRWLKTIPGIGECSAMMVLAEIGDPRRFHNKEALAVTLDWCRGCEVRLFS